MLQISVNESQKWAVMKDDAVASYNYVTIKTQML